MKKYLVFLLIVVLALLNLTACDSIIPATDEVEGENEVGAEGVSVEIESAIQLDNKTYVRSGTHDITVTFPVPVVKWVTGYITDCNGDYSKGKNGDDTAIVFFPNEDLTIWTGSGNFQDNVSSCCASYLKITSGECQNEFCIKLPVIVDSLPPYATIGIGVSECVCEGCELSFNSTSNILPCEPGTINCGDNCSGLAGWSLAIYDDYPFNNCCEIPCTEPLAVYSGTDCPIEVVTDCLDELTSNSLYVVVNLADNVGNETQWGALVEFNHEDCDNLSFTYLDPSDCLDDPNLNNSGFALRKLINGDFETCDFSGWIVTEGGIFPQVQNSQVYSGSCAAYMGDGDGGLLPDHTASIQQIINIPDDVLNPILKLNYLVVGTDDDGEGFDWMKIYINDIEVFYVWEDSSGWQGFQYDLSAYIGSSIDLNISAWSTDSLYIADYYVDNISIAWD